MSELEARIAQLEAELAALRTAQVQQKMEAETITHAQQTVVQGDQHIHAAPLDPAVAQAETALRTYLRRSVNECNALPLGQIDRNDSPEVRPLMLAQLYIGLNTTEQVQDPERAARPDRSATRPLSVLEALSRQERPRTILLGVPGSGKSTFVSHLALCLAQAELNPTDDVATLPGWTLGQRLPIRVILRDLAAFAPLEESPRGTVRIFEQFLATLLADAGCAAALPLLTDALKEGSALLLLDGFDEVVGDSILKRVAEMIRDLDRSYQSPILVTCRVLDYNEEQQRQLAGFATLTLAELDDGQIEQFVGDWYRELAASGRRPAAQAALDAQELRDALASRDELRDLARTPLLLTVMALVHAFRGTLPDARALLYYECIDLLLLRWRQPRGELDLLERFNLPQFRSSDLLVLMAELGFMAHTQAERSNAAPHQPADLDETQVMAILAAGFEPFDVSRRYELAHMMLNALTFGNGLLLKRGDKLYTFAHRTFQEFLAGYHLKRQRDYRKLCLERAGQIHWHESLSLMVSFQVLQDQELEKPLVLAEALLARSPLEQVLGGECLNLISSERAKGYDPELLKLPNGLWPRTRTMLLDLLTKGVAPEVPVALRARAGRALGHLCYGSLASLSRPATAIELPIPDPRLPLALLGLPGQQDAAWLQALETYWRPLAPGPFWYGDDDDTPLVSMPFTEGGKIARFPITNADYARFVAAGGYQQPQWWREVGWRFLQPGGHPYDDQDVMITEPRYWHNSRYTNPLQPVVGVSWYEAAAYCRWLSACGHQQGWLPQHAILRLPTWVEWQRAARGQDQRRYPWGNTEPTPEHANYDQTGLGLPNPVGCFAAGAAACGAEEMAGNVLEWTASAHAEPTAGQDRKDFTPSEDVILSGSAFWWGAEQLCCGSRVRLDPNGGNDDRSFRVFWSPRS
ncbi:NACHT domain-containing protein [Candidatus Oscillochloris fontis]|uniref:NACHT domain-containing protein n=1 Tax=Candidatus Oscillochloris fontis TaxID=2496868 RepID=UPI00137568C2|nr:SUMF1/EgtB/PvdO family nonheme iron enzyme [Candidatus Oscillochloris fontis]